jgi:hypothetical protein
VVLRATAHDWQGSHIRAFEYFGGVPETVVPDNLRSGVNKAHRYDPDLNIDYTRLAERYGVRVVPARVRSPRDKSLVDNAVLIIEREAISQMPFMDRLALLLDREVMAREDRQLVSPQWISKERNVLINGSTSVGKSYFACALAQKACRDGYVISRVGQNCWPKKRGPSLGSKVPL